MFYRSDTNSAILAGNDLKHGLITLGPSRHTAMSEHISTAYSVLAACWLRI